MLEYQKNSFRAGINQQVYSTRLESSEYYFATNSRTRYDIIQGIKSPVQDLSIPEGKFQGLYAAGSLVLLFVSGLAYLRDYSQQNSFFKQITTFSRMDQFVDFIFVELVPGSTINFARTLASTATNSELVLTNPINGSPACVICQDGINQPRLIFSDGTSRISNTYNQWNQDDREYVPIGRQMKYVDGILYTMSPNGLEIFRSVSGRPLDYMINITPSGDKLPLEKDGGASSVSHAVAFTPATGLSKMPIGDVMVLFISTLESSHLAVPDFQNTLFGEPTFGTIDIFTTGMVNNFCFSELLGDSAFIDKNGIRSFNSVRQVQLEGQNAPFSKKIAPLLEGIVQNICASVEFDNYVLFGLRTIYGTAIIVYDTINSAWVSVDMFPETTGNIKQFCQVKLESSRKLFCITDRNEYFELFSSELTADGSFLLGEFTGLTALEPKNCEIKPEELRVVVNNAQESGNLTAELFVDRLSCGKIRKPIAKVFTKDTSIPFGQISQDSVQNITFNFRDISKAGQKFAVLLSWDTMLEITDLYANAIEIQTRNSVEQQSRELAAFKKI